MNQPLIGLTLDSDEGEGISRSARYGLRANYADAIAKAGGMPVGLPHAMTPSTPMPIGWTRWW